MKKNHKKNHKTLETGPQKEEYRLLTLAVDNGTIAYPHAKEWIWTTSQNQLNKNCKTLRRKRRGKSS